MIYLKLLYKVRLKRWVNGSMVGYNYAHASNTLSGSKFDCCSLSNVVSVSTNVTVQWSNVKREILLQIRKNGVKTLAMLVQVYGTEADNVRPHTAMSVCNFLSKSVVTVHEHRPYSPGLVRAGLFCFCASREQWMSFCKYTNTRNFYLRSLFSFFFRYPSPNILNAPCILTFIQLQFLPCLNNPQVNNFCRVRYNS